MKENSELLMKNEFLPFKLKLLFKISLNEVESTNNNNFVKGLLFKLEEIKSIQKYNLPDFLKFLYINKEKVSEKLYDEEEVIKIDFEIKDSKISKYIYLCFLIEDNWSIINYEYTFELIYKLNEIQKDEKEKILKKIIMANMILLLIKYYNGISDNENNKHEEDKIFEFNSNILNDKDNKIKINQYGLKLEVIKSKKIEEIYLIIIKYLIENSKLEDSDYFESIINQIELESINLTKLMLDELIKILTKEKEYIKKYVIENFEDIFNEKK